MSNYKNSIPFDDMLMQQLSTSEDIKAFINAALEEYLEDGDFNAFYRCLEYVIKAQDSISDFAKKTKISRANLYNIFNAKKEPKIQTIAVILKELGYKIQVA